MTMLPASTVTMPVVTAPMQAESDAQLIGLWLHGRSVSTQSAYTGDVQSFLAHVGKPLRAVTLGDLQATVLAVKRASILRDYVGGH
jgi:hypothetical protein